METSPGPRNNISKSKQSWRKSGNYIANSRISWDASYLFPFLFTILRCSLNWEFLSSSWTLTKNPVIRLRFKWVLILSRQKSILEFSKAKPLLTKKNLKSDKWNNSLKTQQKNVKWDHAFSDELQISSSTCAPKSVYIFFYLLNSSSFIVSS